MGLESENGGIVGRLPFYLEFVQHELDKLHLRLEGLRPTPRHETVLGGRGAKSDKARLSDGTERFVVRGTGNGGSVAIAPATAVLLVAEDVGRMGGAVAVAGAATVTLFLQDLQSYQAGLPAPQIPLYSVAGSTDTWDMRLSRRHYVGAIVAYNAGAANATVQWGTM